jgi:hypothetical protein
VDLSVDLSLQLLFHRADVSVLRGAPAFRALGCVRARASISKTAGARARTARKRQRRREGVWAETGGTSGEDV